MTTPYAFYFDASACSGCKACQAACKDKNDLPLGVLWRRVYEISGGEWAQAGGAWTSTVFAYHLSMACNHCAYPKCAGVCPVDAYHVRADGIVLLDTQKCIGCKYCSWACPYGAPQYDAARGTMTKCDLCWDNLEAGKPPACVAACPMRILELADPAELQERGDPVQAVFPMPVTSHTEPRIYMKPHPAAKLSGERAQWANREETSLGSRRAFAWGEFPLILFTLLVQMAVGAFWASLWIFRPLEALRGQIAYRLMPLLTLGIIGLFLILGGLASFAHLGRKRNAWRALKHLRKSWLSREILFSLLFGTGWAFSALLTLTGSGVPAIFWATALLGFGLVYSMAQVYLLHNVPAWDTWRTTAGFLVTTCLLGLSAMAALLMAEARQVRLPVSPTHLAWIATSTLLLLMAQAGLALSAGQEIFGRIERLRLGCILAACLGAVVIALMTGSEVLPGLAVFLLILAEEGLGRWIFYASRTAEM